MEEIELRELTTEQIEALCSVAEDASRKYILSKVSLKNAERLNISVEVEGLKPLNIFVDVDLELFTKIKSLDEKTLVEEAAKKALKEAEIYLRKQK